MVQMPAQRNQAGGQHCTLCQYCCSSKTSLESHMIKAHDMPLLGCDKCTTTFKDRANMNRHKRSAHGPSQHWCLGCQKHIKRADNAKRHQKFNDGKCKGLVYIETEEVMKMAFKVANDNGIKAAQAWLAAYKEDEQQQEQQQQQQLQQPQQKQRKQKQKQQRRQQVVAATTTHVEPFAPVLTPEQQQEIENWSIGEEIPPYPVSVDEPAMEYPMVNPVVHPSANDLESGAWAYQPAAPEVDHQYDPTYHGLPELPGADPVLEAYGLPTGAVQALWNSTYGPALQEQQHHLQPEPQPQLEPVLELEPEMQQVFLANLDLQLSASDYSLSDPETGSDFEKYFEKHFS